MTTLFIRHAVTDYTAWKQTYDGAAPMQQRLGVTGSEVYRDTEDANTVTVAHEFASPDAARQYLGSDELRAAMDNAGLAGEPTVWFADRV